CGPPQGRHLAAAEGLPPSTCCTCKITAPGGDSVQFAKMKMFRKGKKAAIGVTAFCQMTLDKHEKSRDKGTICTGTDSYSGRVCTSPRGKDVSGIGKVAIFPSALYLEKST
ncbi:hypothetical protein BaRGS_00028876, partial [Batillaria attramentaria]